MNKLDYQLRREQKAGLHGVRVRLDRTDQTDYALGVGSSSLKFLLISNRTSCAGSSWDSVGQARYRRRGGTFIQAPTFLLLSTYDVRNTEQERTSHTCA